MTYSEYVSRQKEIIKNNHKGEEFLLIKGEVIPLRSADEVLKELDSMDGLFNGAAAFGSFSRSREWAY